MGSWRDDRPVDLADEPRLRHPSAQREQFQAAVDASNALSVAARLGLERGQRRRLGVLTCWCSTDARRFDALGPHEVLAYGGLDVRVVTHTDRRLVRTSQDLKLRADAPRACAEWLIVRGGGWDARHRDLRAEAALGAVGAFARAHRRRGGKLAAVSPARGWRMLV